MIELGSHYHRPLLLPEGPKSVYSELNFKYFLTFLKTIPSGIPVTLGGGWGSTAMYLGNSSCILTKQFFRITSICMISLGYLFSKQLSVKLSCVFHCGKGELRFAEKHSKKLPPKTESL